MVETCFILMYTLKCSSSILPECQGRRKNYRGRDGFKYIEVVFFILRGLKQVFKVGIGPLRGDRGDLISPFSATAQCTFKPYRIKNQIYHLIQEFLNSEFFNYD